jgi:DNA polymerase-3 subunit gamma/tau
MLATRLRPRTFDEVRGNRSTVAALRKLLDGAKLEEIPHAFLFYGPSGTGKTTLARIIAQEIHCDPGDLIEINAADTRGIDTIRELVDNTRVAPLFGPARMVILDEAHQLTSAAQNALLKILEDTPAHTVWAICTTEPDGILKTVHTRCVPLSTGLLRYSEMLELLEHASTQLVEEGISTELKEKLAHASGGSPRRALMLLEKCAFVDEEQAKDMAATESVDGYAPSVLELAKNMMAGGHACWAHAMAILASKDEEPEKVRLALVSLIMNRLLTEKDNGAVGWLNRLLVALLDSGPLHYAPDARARLATRIFRAINHGSGV